MKKVLIISTSFEEQRMIEEVMKASGPAQLTVETTASFGQEAAWWSTQGPDILVLQLPSDTLLQESFFTKLKKDVPKSQPIIFLCEGISSSLMMMSSHFSKVRMLKAPVNGFDLYRTVIDLIADYKEGQRQIHPRYLTDQPVEISSDYKPGRASASMKNLSMGGAYFEANVTGFSIESGDLVKLSILVGEPAKQYVFDAKVVWVKETGFGVTFIDRDEVYNNLLKNI